MNDIFIVTALEMLAKTRPKQVPDLAAACKEVLEMLQTHKNKQIDALLLRPLAIAMASKIPEAVDVALDCLAKLFSFQRLLTIEAVEAVCAVFVADSTTEKTQTQIVKALAASASLVHAGVLLKCVRATYNIFLLSKYSNVQTLAQAVLSQTLDIVCSRIQVLPFATIMIPHPRMLSKNRQGVPELPSTNRPTRTASLESMYRTIYVGILQTHLRSMNPKIQQKP